MDSVLRGAGGSVMSFSAQCRWVLMVVWCRGTSGVRRGVMMLVSVDVLIHGLTRWEGLERGRDGSSGIGHGWATDISMLPVGVSMVTTWVMGLRAGVEDVVWCND